jgi:hypothetical protein
MRNVSFAVWLSLAAALLGACANGGANGLDASAGLNPAPEGSSLPAAPRKPPASGWLSPAIESGTSGPLIYASEVQLNEVAIYPESGPNMKPIGKITSGVVSPWGLWVDQNGNLYVTNQTGSVKVYPPGSTTPSVTYAQDLYRPLFTVVDGYGDVFVGNGESSLGGGGTVVEYPAGSTDASAVLHTPGNEVDGMDFDQQGNLYVAYRSIRRDRGPGDVEEFAPGSTEGTTLGLKLHQPQGLVVDSAGNILVTDTAPSSDNVSLFAAGAHKATLKVKLPDKSVPVQLAITADESELFVSAWNNKEIYETAYPLSAASVWTAYDGVESTLQGIALSNGQAF